MDGNGEATISEVAFTTKYVAPASEDARKTKEDKLQAELEALQLKLQVLQTKRTRLIKQRQVLDGFADKLTAARPVGDKSADVSNKTQASSGLVLELMVMKLSALFSANHSTC